MSYTVKEFPLVYDTDDVFFKIYIDDFIGGCGADN